MRPKPFRGDQVAAGAVALTVLVALVDARLADAWALGVRFALTAAAAAYVSFLGFGSPTEPTSPRGYQTTLYVAGYALTALALLLLARVLGADGVGGGTLTWVGAALTGYAAAAARRGSATGSLLVALSGITTVLAFAHWALGADAPQTYRWLLCAMAGALALTAVAQRDRRPAHAVQLANAGGLALLALAGTTVPDVVAPVLSLGLHPAPDRLLGWGWELVLLAGGFGLVAYAAVDHARGPAVIGIAVLSAFTAIASSGDATLLGWPVALAVAAAALLAIGLRPTTPAPPEPGADAEPPPPIEVRPDRG